MWRGLLSCLVVAGTISVGPAGVRAQADCESPYAAIYASRSTTVPIFGLQQVWPADPVVSPIHTPPLEGQVVDGVLIEVSESSTIVHLPDGDDGSGPSLLVPVAVGDVPDGSIVSEQVVGSTRYVVLWHLDFVLGKPIGFLVVWDLDEPCRSLPVVSTTTTTTLAPTTSGPTATTFVPSTTVVVDCMCVPPPPTSPGPPPATPVSASASYTG